jgi:hypothetical protein
MNDNILIIDAALGGIYDRIGFYLTEAGLEDASGARRFCMDLLRQGEWDKAAGYLKTDTETLRREFGQMYKIGHQRPDGSIVMNPPRLRK